MRAGNRENRNCNWWQKWQVRSGESLHNSSNRFWSGGRGNLLPKLTQYVGEGELCIWFHLFFDSILDLGCNLKTGRLFYHWPTVTSLPEDNKTIPYLVGSEPRTLPHCCDWWTTATAFFGLKLKSLFIETQTRLTSLPWHRFAMRLYFAGR